MRRRAILQLWCAILRRRGVEELEHGVHRQPQLDQAVAEVDDRVCSGVKTARGPLGAPCASGCEEVGTRADVDAAAWGRTPEAGGAVVD